MIRHLYYPFRRLLVPVLCLSFLISGCFSSGQNPALEQPIENSNDRDAETPPADRQSGLPPREQDSDKLQLSASDSSNSATTLTDPNQKQQGMKPPKITKKEQDPNQLSLLDVYIHESVTSVIMKLGIPGNHYVIEDLAESITIYEYDDFSIGFNSYQQLEFVEIHSSSIDPGLNGLRLGDTVIKAIEALGEPDTQSSFVLSYVHADSVLKLDMDPNTDTILSIKLFAVQ